MSVTDNLTGIRKSIPANVKLVAVSKFHSVDAIKEAYECNQRVFGESRMQELDIKQQQLPDDIEWHFIGHLQTNKVKAIVPYTHVVQSVDSERLLVEIDKQASAIGKPIACLLEIHIAQEDAKCGFLFDEGRQLLNKGLWRNMHSAYIAGLMGMATNTDNEECIRKEFRGLKDFFDELKSEYFANDGRFNEISMGMSQDYPIAIEEGATIVRVGSSIFGQREY